MFEDDVRWQHMYVFTSVGIGDRSSASSAVHHRHGAQEDRKTKLRTNQLTDLHNPETK